MNEEVGSRCTAPRKLVNYILLEYELVMGK